MFAVLLILNAAAAYTDGEYPTRINVTFTARELKVKQRAARRSWQQQQLMETSGRDLHRGQNCGQTSYFY